MTLTDHIVGFFGLVANGSAEIYNEFSLQHEFGLYLRSIVPAQFRVQFERPVGFFELKPLAYIKKEIDVVIYSPERKYKLAVELKYPRNGQYPEQIFKMCQDIGFLEQLVEGGFDGGAFVVAAEDPLFFGGNTSKGDIYGYFRACHQLNGTISKPTGAKNETVTISGTHTIKWMPSGPDVRFAFVCIGDEGKV